MASDETVTMWRCTVCGKWSHAARRPQHHERFVRDSEVISHLAVGGAEHGLRNGLPVLRTDYGHDGDGGGEWLACGPFERWNASRCLADALSRSLESEATRDE